MLARAALLFVVLALTGAAWMLLRDPPRPDAPVRTRAVDGLAHAASTEDHDLVAPDEATSTVRAGAGVAPEARRTVEPEGVLVRAHLSLASGAQQDFSDWEVQMQVREPAGTLRLVSARADADGLALLRDRTPLHADWVRCTPPEASGWAAAAVDVWGEVDADDPLDVELVCGRGGFLSGIVVDLADRPVAGVRMHAFEGGPGGGLQGWGSSSFVTASDAAGRFRFPRLAEGTWGVSVEPGEWMQIEPGLDDNELGSNVFSIAVDAHVDSARLRVVRGERFVVRVVDRAGDAVQGATVQVESVSVLGGAMLPFEPDTPDPLEAFLSGSWTAVRDEPFYPYGWSTWTTDERGEVRALGVTGLWSIHAWGPHRGSSRIGTSASCELDLPGSGVTLVLDVPFLECRAQLVDEGGRPVPGKGVEVVERGSDHVLSTLHSDGYGRFRALWLHPDVEYDFIVRPHGPFVAIRVPFAATAPGAEEQRVVLPMGTAPSLRLVLATGEPVRFQPLRIVDFRPNRSSGVELSEVVGIKDRSLQTNREGTAHLPELPAGEFVLGLVRTTALGGVDEWGNAVQVDSVGRPLTEHRVVRTWTLPVQSELQEIVLEVAEPPEPVAPPLPKHVGTVRDAVTGAPVHNALVAAHTENAMCIANTDTEGRFSVRGLPRHYELTVTADGYELACLRSDSWARDTHQHEVLLRPGIGDVEVTFQDADGAELPDVVVQLFDPSGRPTTVATRTEHGVSNWSSRIEAVRGRVTFVGLPPGRWTSELALPDGNVLGRCVFDVAEQSGLQRTTGRFARSLDELRRELRERIDALEDEDG